MCDSNKQLFVNPEAITLEWTNLITDELEMVAEGIPEALVDQWLEDGTLIPFAKKDGLRHFYTKDVWRATIGQVLGQDTKAIDHDPDEEVMD
ncbi:hypothetical protein [Staphylococcus massiliensis]|uniref:hypothetical protein n=1 Tax=Staphylococcus massiliensis TaxID=555791 RepID=UPI001EDE2289|nr:hypothetical protein [Staphylococcus massiliensis]MCG3400223.1 hypothetical protein [Staphylococcus massiliensis]MCG3401854.1 hypothetical protein [Staphylococcus massiliensis]MCG3413106.1 hypothetical protein [Staphylococcus massiliensis]